MKQEFFEWEKYSKDKENLVFPVDAMEDIFLINVEKDSIWLSRKCAEMFSDGEGEPPVFINQ